MRVPVLFVLIILAAVLAAQPFPQGYFRSPMDITLRLSGNFGELRPNHFHAGIDITTQGQEGLPVRAAAEGYVSRIKISPWGYGKAIYVTHPNGYTTVYAHLRSYSGNIDEWVRKQQYIAESFEIELFPAQGELTVTKGQQLGESGNTGSSGGPHLHFEIRDSKTEEALNPLLFGMPVKDTVAPVLVTLVVYALGDNSYVNGKEGKKKITLIKSGKKYILKTPADSISVYGEIGFGLEAYDKENIAQGKNGVYSIQLNEGKRILYKHELDRIPFEQSRYINCFVDYAEHERTGKYFQLSYLLPNNELAVYDTVVNRGFLNCSDGKYHFYTYEIKDAYGNSSLIEFKVKALTKNPELKLAATEYKPFVQVLAWSQSNRIETDEFIFETPEKSVYRNTVFTYTIKAPSGNRVSPVITINDRFTPLHKVCTLTISMPSQTPEPHQLVIAKDKTNGGVTCVGGKWNGSGISADIKEFGTYFVMRDTTAPAVKAHNFDQKGKTTGDFTGIKSIQLKIGDNLSGVKYYRGTIDGKWVLFEYEPKKDLLVYTFDSAFSANKKDHELVMIVTDGCGNTTEYRKSFTR